MCIRLSNLSTILSSVTELSTVVKSGNPYIHIVCGINDAIAGRTLAQFQTDYLALIQAIKAFGGIPVVTKIAYLGTAASGYVAANVLVTTYNTWVGTLGLKVVDENTVTTLAGVMNALYTTDGIHPIDFGHAIIANSFLTQLLKN